MRSSPSFTALGATRPPDGRAYIDSEVLLSVSREVLRPFFVTVCRAEMKHSALQVATASLNAALYAALGALWTLFPVTLFGVRFWPQVFAPGAFAVLFGPWVGGIGAGVGIFIADVVYGHHDALLSLLVGVPSNLAGFGLIGYISRRPMKGSLRLSTIAAGLAIPVVIAAYAFYAFSGSAAIYVVVLGAAVTALLAVPYLAKSRWAEVQAASSIGLGVGSLIIGLGIVSYSSFFVMPQVLGLGSGPLPLAFAVGATLWTYMSEIPFLLALTPPIVRAAQAAFPGLKISQIGTSKKSNA